MNKNLELFLFIGIFLIFLSIIFIILRIRLGGMIVFLIGGFVLFVVSSIGILSKFLKRKEGYR